MDDVLLTCNGKSTLLPSLVKLLAKWPPAEDDKKYHCQSNVKILKLCQDTGAELPRYLIL